MQRKSYCLTLQQIVSFQGNLTVKQMTFYIEKYKSELKEFERLGALNNQ